MTKKIIPAILSLFSEQTFLKLSPLKFIGLNPYRLYAPLPRYTNFLGFGLQLPQRGKGKKRRITAFAASNNGDGTFGEGEEENQKEEAVNNGYVDFGESKKKSQEEESQEEETQEEEEDYWEDGWEDEYEGSMKEDKPNNSISILPENNDQLRIPITNWSEMTSSKKAALMDTLPLAKSTKDDIIYWLNLSPKNKAIILFSDSANFLTSSEKLFILINIKEQGGLRGPIIEFPVDILLNVNKNEKEIPDFMTAYRLLTNLRKSAKRRKIFKLPSSLVLKNKLPSDFRKQGNSMVKHVLKEIQLASDMLLNIFISPGDITPEEDEIVLSFTGIPGNGKLNNLIIISDNLAKMQASTYLEQYLNDSLPFFPSNIIILKRGKKPFNLNNEAIQVFSQESEFSEYLFVKYSLENLRYQIGVALFSKTDKGSNILSFLGINKESSNYSIESNLYYKQLMESDFCSRLKAQNISMSKEVFISFIRRSLKSIISGLDPLDFKIFFTNLNLSLTIEEKNAVFDEHLSFLENPGKEKGFYDILHLAISEIFRAGLVPILADAKSVYKEFSVLKEVDSEKEFPNINFTSPPVYINNRIDKLISSENYSDVDSFNTIVSGYQNVLLAILLNILGGTPILLGDTYCFVLYDPDYNPYKEEDKINKEFKNWLDVLNLKKIEIRIDYVIKKGKVFSAINWEK